MLRKYQTGTICIFVFLLFQANLFAQIITGTVIDGINSLPIEFANVIAKTIGDSTYISGTTTDKDGKFTLNAVEKVLVSISCVGYKTIYITGNLNLGTILLVQDAKDMQEVVVSAKVRQFKFVQNGIVADVQNTILSKVGNASDVLDKLPLVTKKKDSYIVFGKGIPLIYVNNRLLHNNVELQQINSSDIKSVEIITNPDASYNAETNSVIRITTKKPAGEGFSGIVNAEIKVNRKFSHNENLSINYRHKGFDVFGRLAYFDNRSKEKQTMLNSFNYNVIKTEIGNKGTFDRKGQRILTTIGFNQQISKSHSFGMRYIFSDLPTDNTNENDIYTTYIEGITADSVKSSNLLKSKTKYHYLNVYYSGQIFEKLTFNLDMDYSKGDSHDNSVVFNKTVLSALEELKTENNSDFNLSATKLKFDADIWSSKLSFGGEYSHTKDNQDYSITFSNFEHTLVPNVNTSNQNLFAFFASFAKNIDAVSLDFGLRYESVDLEYLDDGVKNNINSKTYKGLYPNLSVSYEHKDIQTSLSYRSSTTRPPYNQLANSISFLNNYTYQSGNPYLKPTRQDEFTYSFMLKSLYAMASYSFSHNQVINGNSQYGDENIILYKPINIDRSSMFSLVCGYSIEVGIWQSNIELSMQNQYLKSGTPETKFNKPIFLSDVKNYFKLPKDFTALFSLSGNTSGNTDISYYYGKYRVDFGIIKTCLKGKLRFNLNVNDIFKNDNEKWKININNTFTSKWNDQDSREITFSVTYLFNKTKSKYMGSSASNELYRVTK